MVGSSEPKRPLSTATRSWLARGCCGITGCTSIFPRRPLPSRRGDRQAVANGSRRSGEIGQREKASEQTNKTDCLIEVRPLFVAKNNDSRPIKIGYTGRNV